MQKIIEDILDNSVKNLHPMKREELFNIMIADSSLTSRSKCWNKASSVLCLTKASARSQNYWVSRGWNESESKYKAKQVSKNYTTKSVFSVNTWLEKINIETGKNYTLTEAQYECDSRRSIRKEYWMKRGMCETDAVIKAAECKSENNKKGTAVSKNRSTELVKSTSVKCAEFWLMRGYSESEAKVIISESQETFSLNKCILRFGEEEGTKVWRARQEKWQSMITSKSAEELAEIREKQRDWINTLSEEELKIWKEKISVASSEFWDSVSTEYKIAFGKKIRDTQVLTGRTLPLEELEDQRRYNTLVDRVTRCQPIATLENFDLRAAKNFHLDHKYSKLAGYKNSVSPEVIGHICNLEMIPYYENISKQSKCSITLETLLENIEKYNANNQINNGS